MKGRDFLIVSQRLALEKTEADWRSATGRAYYALMLEARDILEQWGFALPRRDHVHAFVRLRFLYATDSDLKSIGHTLEQLGVMRNQADYRLDKSGIFASAKTSPQASRNAATAIDLLDQIEAAPSRRAAAIAAIRAAFGP